MSVNIFSTKVLIGDTSFVLPFADVTMSDIEEAAPENSLIEVIEIEEVLIRDFPEDRIFFSIFAETLLCYIFVFCYCHLLFCCKINILNLLKMVKI